MTLPPVTPDPLRPVLQAAEEELSDRLKQACENTAVSEETTGELMRLEENLIDAAKAAKQAISLRRRIRTQRASDAGAPTGSRSGGSGAPGRAERRSPSVSRAAAGTASAAAASTVPPAQTAPAVQAAPTVPPAALTPPAGPESTTDRPAMREFADERGQQWRVWAVTPDQMHRRTRSEAYMQEYRDGWLAFESFDGTDRRRLPHYPADWDRLADAELEQLMVHAEVARGRKNSPPRGNEIGDR